MRSEASPRFWRRRRVFLTGATGLLGGWTLKRLVELEAEVVALVRDRVPNSLAAMNRWVDSVTSVTGCLEDAGLMFRAMAEYEIDTVIHVAAQPIVGVAKVDPAGTFRANIEGTWNVLDAARRAKVRQTLIASSDKAYGDSDQLPYLEEHPLQGRYPYDCSKACADMLAQSYLATFTMPVSIVRCANLFGGGDLNFNRLIPGVIRATNGGERFVIRSDGRFVRDYLYVEDAAEAYLLLTEGLAAGAPQGPYNFSLEMRLTVLEIVNAVLAIMGRSDLEPVILNQASAEIRDQHMSCAKARSILNWAPSFSLDEGLRRTVRWYQNHLPSMHEGETAAYGVAAAN